MPYRIFAFLLVLSISYFSQAAELFTVDGIKVNSSGTSAKEAKDSAVFAGEKEAFGKLLERIAPGQGNAVAKNITYDQLTELVQGIEVEDEKITANFYSATLSISFNKPLVDQLLEASSISYIDKKSAPIVILPLLVTTQNGNMLFEDNNPLKAAFKKIIGNNHLLKLIIPSGSLPIDKNNLSANIENIPAEIKDELRKIGQRYNADKLILVVAWQDTANQDTLKVRLQNIQNDDGSIKEMSFKAGNAKNGEDIFAYAAGSITSAFEQQWLKGKSQNKSSASRTTITVPINSLEDWSDLRKHLESLGFINNITIKSLTAKYAQIDISSGESLETLAGKMSDNGFSLTSSPDGIILQRK